MIPIDLSGRTALITGSSRGIGRAMALAFARAGARLGLNYVENDEAASSLLEEIRGGGGQAILYKGSVADKAFVEDMVGRCAVDLGGLDCLVNNAGIARDTYIAFMEESHWDDVLSVNLKAAFLCSKAALKKMVVQKRGAIVNISSTSGLTGREGQVNYSAAKAGLLGLTKAMAREAGRYGVRVNAIVTGVIDTDMTKKLPRKILDAILSHASLHRLGRPEEVANLAAFLASDLASYITGSCVCLDGGL